MLDLRILSYHVPSYRPETLNRTEYFWYHDTDVDFSSVRDPSSVTGINIRQETRFQPLDSYWMLYHEPITVPPEIERFTELESLTIRCMGLNPLPDSLQKLEYLRSFKLVTSSMVPIFHCPDFSHMRHLTSLRIHSSGLEFLSPSIGALRELEELDLYGCLHIYALPSSIRNLINLTSVDLSYCNFAVLPFELSFLTQLRELWLGNNPHLASIPAWIDRLQNLRHLDLRSCSYFESLPDSIGNLHELEILNLGGCWRLTSVPDSYLQP